MKTGKYITILGAIMLLAPSFTSTAYAKSFKAKYYKECHAGVKEVADLVKPKESMQQKTKKASGLLGAVGSFAGLGGFGGKAVQAANAVQKIEKYSGIIDNVAAFSSHMVEEHPNPNDRFASYGTHMSKDAADLMKVKAAVMDSQTCYSDAYQALRTDMAAGKIKKRKAKKRLKEIQKGTTATGNVLLNAMNHMNKNMASYDQALGGDKQAITYGFSGVAAQLMTGNTGGLAAAGYGNADANAYARNAYIQAVNHSKGGTAKSSPVANFSVLSGLAGIASAASREPDTADALPRGAQAVANASHEYVGLYEGFMDTVESQRQLELTVNKGL